MGLPQILRIRVLPFKDGAKSAVSGAIGFIWMRYAVSEVAGYHFHSYLNNFFLKIVRYFYFYEQMIVEQSLIYRLRNGRDARASGGLE
ncbi:hypothetical protein ASG01_04550 [Chryseobacterium sp. Leaf180]|nr:hypothetical protein ASG01_04550 [Chryseobacterium sp. Leaf180]